MQSGRTNVGIIGHLQRRPGPVLWTRRAQAIESPFYMTRSFVYVVVLVAVSVTLAAQQGQPQIGIAPVTLTAGPYSFDTAEQHRLKVSIVARGLAHPFSLAFLPNGDALVTERGVRLRVIRGATGVQAKVDADPVAGLPQMPTFRTGGLHEIALHPKFATNGLFYFTYNKAGDVSPTNPQQRQSAIVLARAKFDGKALTNVQDLFVGNWNSGASGSRLAFGPDGFIYITTGAPSAIRHRTPTPSTARCCVCATTVLCLRTIHLSGNKDTGQKCSRWGTAINSVSPSIRRAVRCSLRNTVPMAATRSTSSCPAATTDGRSGATAAPTKDHAGRRRRWRLGSSSRSCCGFRRSPRRD